MKTSRRCAIRRKTDIFENIYIYISNILIKMQLKITYKIMLCNSPETLLKTGKMSNQRGEERITEFHYSLQSIDI